MNIDYDMIQNVLNEFGNNVLICIKEQFMKSLTSEQLGRIDELLSANFIIVHRPSNEDIEFFSRQAGIMDPNEYSIDYVPSAHGGRTKGDDLIHIYPYSKSFESSKTTEEIIDECVNDMIVHEIFHYFIRPNIDNELDQIKDGFGHFITEGLVQLYSENFAKNNGLVIPHSNYDKNVEYARKIVESYTNHSTRSQIDKVVFTYNQDELLQESPRGNIIYEEYVSGIEFKNELGDLIIELGAFIGIHEESKELQGILRHFKKMENLDIILDELKRDIELIFKEDLDKQNDFISRLNELISKRKEELERYSSLNIEEPRRGSL